MSRDVNNGSQHVGWWCVLLLSCACLVVYVKDLNRRMLIQNQKLMQDHHHLTARWGRLLLEQSAWSTQARIQKVAQNQLAMQLPASAQTIVLSAKKKHERA